MLQCTLKFLNNNNDEVTRRISNESLGLSTYYWDPHISSLSNIKHSLSKTYGGRVDVSVGGFNVLPLVFDEQGSEGYHTWPPPETMEVLIEYGTDDTPGNKITLFEGTAHHESVNRADISYKLYSLAPSYKVRSLKIEEQSLTSVFADFVTIWSPDYTLDVTYAASPSPVVDIISPDSEMLFIDVLADICEYHNHFFYIDNANRTVHLISMNVSNGTSATVTEYDFLPSSYTFPSPIRSVSAGDSSIPGSYSYGREINFSNICIPDAYIRIGDNSGDDTVWIIHNGATDVDGVPNFIPYDPDKLYRFTLKYRKKSGTHSVYGGFHCMLNLTTSNNVNGDDQAGSQHYVFMRSGAADDKWHTVTGYITGEATPGTANTGEDGTTILGTIPARKARTNTTFIRPLIISNYNAQPGITDIAYCAIHEIEWDSVNQESDGSILNTLFEYKAERFSPDEWQFVAGNASLVEASAQEAINNILVIANKSQMNLRMPLEVDNIFRMGQAITWIDESQHRTINADMKVRGIDYDFDNSNITIIGEGNVEETI